MENKTTKPWKMNIANIKMKNKKWKNKWQIGFEKWKNDNKEWKNKKKQK